MNLIGRQNSKNVSSLLLFSFDFLREERNCKKRADPLQKFFLSFLSFESALYTEREIKALLEEYIPCLQTNNKRRAKKDLRWTWTRAVRD